MGDRGMGKVKRTVIVLIAGVLLLAGSGCGMKDKAQSSRTAATHPQEGMLPELEQIPKQEPTPESQPVNEEVAPITDDQESRQPEAHPPRFLPESVRVGDTVAGMKVRSVKSGTTPMPYFLMELEGELKLSGYYYQGNDGAMYFFPDQASRERLPRVADEAAGEPVTVSYRFAPDVVKTDLGDAQLGTAEVVISGYTVRYVPNADNQHALLEDGQAYLELGDMKLSFENERRITDLATPQSIRVEERFHTLLPAGPGIAAKKTELGQYRWKGMRVNLETLSLWQNDNRDKLYLGGLIGNHAEILTTEKVQKDGRELYYLEVERDVYDEQAMHYNGEMSYEYWLVSIYEDASAALQQEDRQTALTLSLISEKKKLAGAKQKMLELAQSWSLPPEDILIR